MREKALQDITEKAKLEIAEKSNELYSTEKAKDLRKVTEQFKHKTGKIMERAKLKSQKKCKTVFKNIENIQQCRDYIGNTWVSDKNNLTIK
jgi:DNA topoisomerase VI subunit B